MIRVELWDESSLKIEKPEKKKDRAKLKEITSFLTHKKKNRARNFDDSKHLFFQLADDRLCLVFLEDVTPPGGEESMALYLITTWKYIALTEVLVTASKGEDLKTLDDMFTDDTRP